MTFSKRDLGLYIHIPFCVRKCAYCDFFSLPGQEASLQHAYIEALLKEIRTQAAQYASMPVSTVYIGGGTPSALKEEDLAVLFDTLFSSFAIGPDAEVTMEVNPGTLTAEKAALAERYVNRISLGVQSFSDAELKTLGRIHTAREAKEAAGLLRDAGIDNLSFDLMYGLPGQTKDSWEASLAEALALSPRHISAYSLIVEEGTPFHALFKEGLLQLPSEEEEDSFAKTAGVILRDAGFRQYEISNYAREGAASRHNIRYWKRASYLGLGAGASSLMGDVRWRNTRDLKIYLEHSGDVRALRREEMSLDREARIEEFMFLGLRMTEGISEKEFTDAFGTEPDAVYGTQLKKQAAEGFLIRRDGRILFTRRGMDLSNILLADYLF